MILSDRDIAVLALNGMISPFESTLVRRVNESSVVSYGLGSFAYDMRLGFQFKRPVSGVLDPKKPSTCYWHNDSTQYSAGDQYWINPGEMVLAETVEYWNIPEDIFVTVVGKSTYARCGLIVNVTPMEPGWCGILTLEISNTSSLPACVYIGEGIAAALFFKGDRPQTTYADRGGKYQNQIGVTASKV